MRPKKLDFFIGLELTRHCNLRCKHCLRRDLDKFAELPYEFIEKLLDESVFYNKPHIAITGGESTLHSRFKDIIDLLVRRGHTFHFVTNGTTIRRVFNQIGQHAGGPYWDGVSISMDGATAATHESVRGEKTFRKVLQAISVCKVKGLFVVVQMVVNRLNRHEMRQMAELCSALRVDHLYFAHMQPTTGGVEEGIFLTPQEWDEIDLEIKTIQRDYRMPIQQSAGFYDLMPLSHCKFLRNGALNIDYRGRLTVCCQLSNTGADNDPELDVVADLNQTTLAAAHQQLLDVYNEIHKARLQKMVNGSFSKADNFHCWFCMKHFKKLEYLKKYPQNPWVQMDKDLQVPAVSTETPANDSKEKPHVITV